jgi:hypothetical protein
MAPQDSVVGEYLEDVKTKVSSNRLVGFDKYRGQKWIAPKADPVSEGIGGEPVPNKWYTGQVWIYVWMPLAAYPNLLPPKHPCAYCGDCNTTSKGLHWRPMVCLEKVTWILHQHFQCNNPNCCKSTSGSKPTFASIDPRALSKLPTRVAERFEFITTAGGIGIHRSLMYMFCSLMNYQIMFGTFVNMINELHHIDYSTQSVSYVDALDEWSPSNIGYSGMTAIKFYSAFGKAGEHNGIGLTPGLLKSLFCVFMETHEQYMQTSFQMNYDEGLAPDDTFKYSKKAFTNTTGKKPCGAFCMFSINTESTWNGCC